MKVKNIIWKEQKTNNDVLLMSTNLGPDCITVLDRETGFISVDRDTETGYRNQEDNFWLASGMFDIRKFGDLTILQAIAKIKENANEMMGEQL